MNVEVLGDDVVYGGTPFSRTMLGRALKKTGKAIAETTASALGISKADTKAIIDAAPAFDPTRKPKPTVNPPAPAKPGQDSAYDKGTKPASSFGAFVPYMIGGAVLIAILASMRK
jgi:hypothetical protein